MTATATCCRRLSDRIAEIAGQSCNSGLDRLIELVQPVSQLRGNNVVVCLNHVATTWLNFAGIVGAIPGDDAT